MMEKEAVLRNRTQHNYSAKSRLRLQNTQKLDCPAEIQIEKCATMNSLTMATRTILKQLEKKSAIKVKMNLSAR